MATTTENLNPSLEELRYYYTGQQNLAATAALTDNPQEFINNLIIGADRDIAHREYVESSLRFKSVAEPLVAKPSPSSSPALA